MLARVSLCTLLLLSPALAHPQADLPFVAPGLHIPNGSGALPLALDRFGGVPERVPVHHSTIEVNNHKGANVAGSLAGSVFYKPKMTTELPGAHARTVLHDPGLSILVRGQAMDDPGGETAESEMITWALVRATATKSHDEDRRVFAQVRFTSLTGDAKRHDGIVEATTEKLSGGWLKLTPKTALEPGEYAVTPVPHTQNTFASVVYDFTLDPAAPNATDAIAAKPEK